MLQRELKVENFFEAENAKKKYYEWLSACLQSQRSIFMQCMKNSEWFSRSAENFSKVRGP